MPRSDPSREDLEHGAAYMLDAVATLLRNLERAQGELVEAGLKVGLTWEAIAEATGHPSPDAARDFYGRWKAGHP